jgi:protein-disulfide isomerase
MSRTAVVAIVFAVAAAWLGRGAWWPAPALDFAERAAPAGFRDLVTAAGGGSALALLGTLPGEPPPPAIGDACAALFADPGDPRIGTGPVAAVFFTDYRCPYCRLLGDLLLAEADAGRITLIVKQWAALGPDSVAAARLALAAARQDAFRPVHERLKRSAFVPTEAYAEALAVELGLDPARLLADAAAPALDDRLARTASLARALGFAGTPGLVVGRSIVAGAIDRATLAALVETERRSDAPC